MAGGICAVPALQRGSIASIRYLDEFVKQDGKWFFAERRLMVDWTETRPCAP